MRVCLSACLIPSHPILISLLPSLVLTLGAPNLALAEQTLPPPFAPRRVHIARRFHRDAGPRSPRRHRLPPAPFHLRHLDVLPRVELERRLRARDLEVQPRGRVRHAHEGAQAQRARVGRDDGRWVQDEAVIEGRGRGAEGEGRVRFRGAGVGGDFAGRDGVGVEGEMLVCGEGDDVPVDGGGGGVQVEVAGWWLVVVVR